MPRQQSFLPSPRRSPRMMRALAPFLLLALGFGGGYGVGTRARPPLPSPSAPAAAASAQPESFGAPKDLSKDVDFSLFWEVWQRVKQHYLRQPVKDADLFQGAVAGMVASLDDPYSTYLSPKLADEFAKELQGTFDGIGAEIGSKNDRIVVIAPLPDTPASRAGLKAGDAILAIDDRTTLGMSVDQAVNLIRGKGGTKVTLTILHSGAKEPAKVEIVRDKIVVKSVRWESRKTKGGAVVAWIQIRQFNDDTVPLFDRAVRELLKDNPKAVVIDLRNDPGGYLDAAVQVAGKWITGTVVIERKSDGSETPIATQGKMELKGIPTVVLVNQGSASGSEILAGALQDAGVATLVGKKTFGKGSVQDYQELRDGGALKLTVAEWLTPKKRSINKEGIAPDIEIDLADADANADRDPQLDKAYELIDAGAAKGAAAH